MHEASQKTQRLAALLHRTTVVPVVAISSAAKAVPLAHALIAGGVNVIEITFRTKAAEDAAREIKRACPEMILGLGTVTTPEQLAIAARIGADFALSPGSHNDLLAAAAVEQMPFIPGVVTASEVMAATAKGFDVLKFFPAVAGGGLAMLQAFAGPFPDVRFVPTGGIDNTNAATWLAQANVTAIGTSSIAPAALIEAERWNEITDRAQQIVRNTEVRNHDDPKKPA